MSASKSQQEENEDENSEEMSTFFQMGQPLRQVVSSPLKPLGKASKDVVHAVTSPITSLVSSGKSRDSSSNDVQDAPQDGEASRSMASQTSTASAFSYISKGSAEVLQTVISPVKRATDGMKKLGQKKSSSSSSPEDSDSLAVKPEASAIEQVEPDEQLESMELIITRELQGVSVQAWYDKCWSESEDPFYGPWLESSGKEDVVVGDWKVGNVTGDWDLEEYDRTRTVTFRFDRMAGMTAYVTHTHFCRLEKSRCVLSMKVEMKGIPFADAFHVQIRWVGTQTANGLQLLVGLFVVFDKQVLVAGKIRSGTTASTTEMQTDLFRKMKAVCCGAVRDVDISEDEEEPDTKEDQACNLLVHEWLVKRPMAAMSLMFPFVQEESDEDDIDRMIAKIIRDIAVIRDMPSATNQSESPSDNDYVASELKSVQDALDNILLKYIGRKPIPSIRSVRNLDTASSPPSNDFFDTISLPFRAIAGGSAREEMRRKFLESWSNGAGGDEKVQEVGEVEPQPVKPDEALKHMDVIVNKELDSVSPRTFYEVCISEGFRTQYDPFYGPWLESGGKYDVVVPDWDVAAEGESFVDEWNAESYSQKRTVTYKMERSFMPGQTSVSEVTSQQFCRLDGNEKLVWVSKVDTAGVPFGDTFNVRIRWVIAAIHGGGISVKVGLFVVFVKQSMLSGKIRAGTTQETTKQQLSLFRTARASLGGEGSSDLMVNALLDADDEIERHPQFEWTSLPFSACMPWSKTQRLVDEDEALSKQIKTMETKLRSIEPFLEGRQMDEPEHDSERLNFVFNQLEIVHESLDNVITWCDDKLKEK